MQCMNWLWSCCFHFFPSYFFLCSAFQLSITHDMHGHHTYNHIIFYSKHFTIFTTIDGTATQSMTSNTYMVFLCVLVSCWLCGAAFHVQGRNECRKKLLLFVAVSNWIFFFITKHIICTIVRTLETLYCEQMKTNNHCRQAATAAARVKKNLKLTQEHNTIEHFHLLLSVVVVRHKKK